MSIELITGHSGSAHVSGEDVGAFNAGILGSGTYYIGNAPTLTMTDANTLEIGGGAEILMQGRHIRITGTESITIQSGTQSGYRHDIVFVRYSMDQDTGVETASLILETGETASTAETALDPETEFSGASILDGARTVDLPFVRIVIESLTPTPTLLFDQYELPVQFPFPTNKVLWTGSYLMTSGHTASLSERVTEQRHGIVLVWSGYTAGTVRDYDWQYNFIPKWQVTDNPGGGVDFLLVSGTNIGRKYVYIGDDSLYGNADNGANKTYGDVSFANGAFVLRAVIGV